jgi:hypothetical protein
MKNPLYFRNAGQRGGPVRKSGVSTAEEFLYLGLRRRASDFDASEGVPR